MPSLPELSGDINKDLSPLSGDITKDLGPTQAAPSPLKPPAPAMGSMGIPADIQARVERPFGLPKMPVAPASLAVPGAGSAIGKLGPVVPRALGLAGRVGLQGLAGAAEPLVSGQGVKAAAKGGAEGVAGGLAGEAASKVIGSVASPLLKKAADSQVASKITSYLKENVPAWSGMKTLGQMLYSQRGFNRLHEAYDESLKGVIEKGAGKQVALPLEAAQKLGLKVPADPTASLSPMVREALQKAGRLPQGAGALPGQVMVDAGELAKSMTGQWKGAGKAAYRAAANALDAAGIGDPAARQAYKIAMGAGSYLNSSKALGKSGREFDLMAAQSKLGDQRVVDELRKRGMGDMIDLLLPEGQKAITKGTQKVPGAIAGVAAGMLGGGAGGPLGVGVGGAGGEFIGQRLGQMMPKYGNLPATRQAEAIKQLLSRLGGVAGTKGPLGP